MDRVADAVDMTKVVRISNRAYNRIQRARLPGESVSETIERLIEEAPKNPLRFVKRMRALPYVGSDEERMVRIEAERDTSRGPA